MIILALGLFLNASIAAEPVSPEVAPIKFILFQFDWSQLDIVGHV